MSYAAYDYSSSASAPPSPRKAHNALRRRRSPSPAKACSGKPSYHPASRASDAARLLDPSYAASYAASTCPTRAYVDHDGALHDPDYRDFPAIQVPRWERAAVADDDDVSDYDDEHSASHFTAPRRAYGSSYSTASSAAYRHYTAAPARRSYELEPAPRRHSGDNYAYTHSYTTASPPTSFESDVTAFDDSESPFDDESEKKEKKERRGSAVSRFACRTQRVEEPVSEKDEAPRAEEHDDDAHDDEEARDEEPAQQEYTPTCSESIKREWQSLTLAVRFKVFRAKRRVKRRLAKT